MQRNMQKKRRVVVVGGGISALTAAAELARRYKDMIVTIISRGKFDPGDGGGEEFWEHTHNLSAKGLQCFYRLSPESRARLKKANSPSLSWGGKNVLVKFSNGMMVQDSPFMTTQSMSRNLLASELLFSLRDLIASGRIELVERVDVTGFVRNGNKIIGLTMTPRIGATVPDWFAGSGKETRAYADQFVLAVGKGLGWYEWFKEARLTVPDADVIDAHLTYATGNFADLDLGGADMFATGDQDYKAMVISRIEGQSRYKVTITINYMKEDLPTTVEEFIALAETFSPEGAAFLKTGKMVGRVYIYQKCENRLHKFWELLNQPDNVFSLGDMVAALNPKYGQGATLSFLEAQLLAKFFEQGARKYYQALKKLLAFSWGLTTSADINIRRDFRETDVPEQTKVEKLMGRYFTHLLHSAGGRQGRPIAKAFFRTSNYVAPPTSLFMPPVLWAAYRAHRSNLAKSA